MAFIGLLELLSALGLTTVDSGPWYRRYPRQWLYPVQTAVCAAALAVWWRHYEFRPHRGWLLAAVAGLLGILVWILPGYMASQTDALPAWLSAFGCVPRRDGFNPADVAAAGSALYWGIVATRVLRMVVIVPFVEELFWRSFLMRFMTDIDGDYWKVPFGTHHPRSLIVVTAAFVMVHSTADYAAALVFGLLMYGVAVRTKSLSACILMHAVANLCLAIYIISTEQWGYW